MAFQQKQRFKQSATKIDQVYHKYAHLFNINWVLGCDSVWGRMLVLSECVAPANRDSVERIVSGECVALDFPTVKGCRVLGSITDYFSLR